MCFDSLNSSDIACGKYVHRTLTGKLAPTMAYTTAIGSIVYRHQRWQIRQPALQNTVRERNLKVRTPCFVPPGHVVPTAFSGMTHSCTQNSVKTATGVFDFGLKCHFSGLLFPKSANNRHSSMILYIPSAILGRNHGRGTIFIHPIRATGEIFRTGSSTIHFADILGKKLLKCIKKQGKPSFCSTVRA